MSIEPACRKHDIGEPVFFRRPRPLRREGALDAHRLKDAESKPHAAPSRHAAKPEIPACIGTHAVGRNRRCTRDRFNGARSGKSKRDCGRHAGANPRPRLPIGEHRESGYRPRPAAHACLAKRSTTWAWPSSPIKASCILRWPRGWPTLPRIHPPGDHHAAPDISSCGSRHEADTTPMPALHAISRGVISRRQMRLPETGPQAMAFTAEFAGASKTSRTRTSEASFQLAYRS